MTQVLTTKLISLRRIIAGFRSVTHNGELAVGEELELSNADHMTVWVPHEYILPHRGELGTTVDHANIGKVRIWYLCDEQNGFFPSRIIAFVAAARGLDFGWRGTCGWRKGNSHHRRWALGAGRWALGAGRWALGGRRKAEGMSSRVTGALRLGERGAYSGRVLGFGGIALVGEGK
ncbi:hypothetical protein [Actinoplanes sp. NPDC026619]|uniref:hypothetical protein n=1 Tax=Actinoplanes sp. NPDC026619 TaxID=3155798 RepID=UPI0034064C40